MVHSPQASPCHAASSCHVARKGAIFLEYKRLCDVFQTSSREDHALTGYGMRFAVFVLAASDEFEDMTGRPFVANMGIYVFKKKVLLDLLSKNFTSVSMQWCRSFHSEVT
jgi:hypothetical protein